MPILDTAGVGEACSIGKKHMRKKRDEAQSGGVMDAEKVSIGNTEGQDFKDGRVSIGMGAEDATGLLSLADAAARYRAAILRRHDAAEARSKANDVFDEAEDAEARAKRLLLKAAWEVPPSDA